MSSTHLSLHYHLVFGTKNHEPVITPAWRDRLHAYLGGAIRTLDGVPGAVGGMADHVHLLVGLRATHTLADVVREIKSVSSKWVHEEVGVGSFAWQEGYGGFTVSAFAIGKSSTLHSTTAGTSSNTHLSRGMFGIASTWCRGISLKFSPAPARGC